MRFVIPIMGILLMWVAAFSGFWKKVQRRTVESVLGILLMWACIYFDLWPLAPVAAIVTAHGLLRRCGPYHSLPAFLILTVALAFFLTGADDLPQFNLLGIDVLGGLTGAITSAVTLVIVVWTCAEVLIVHRGGDRQAGRRMMISLLVAPMFPTESRLKRLFTNYASSLRILQIVRDGRVVHSVPPSEDFQMPGPGILIIRSGNAAVLEKSGKITRILGPGFHLTETWEHLSAIVDLSLQSETWARNDVLTKDSIPLEIELTVQYRIMVDQPALIKKAEYKLDEDAIRRAVLTTSGWQEETKIVAESVLCDTIATRYLDEIYDPSGKRFSSGSTPRVPLQHKLRCQLGRQSQRWGVEIVRVDLNNITLPDEVGNRMIEAWDVYWHDVVEIGRAVTEAKAIATKALGEGEAEYVKAIKAARARLEAAGVDHLLKVLEARGTAQAEMEAARIARDTKRFEAQGEVKAELEAANVRREIAKAEAQSRLTKARARADARMIEGRAEAAAEAERFRQLLGALQQEFQVDEQTLRQMLIEMCKILTTASEYKGMLRFLSAQRAQLPEPSKPPYIIGGSKEPTSPE